MIKFYKFAPCWGLPSSSPFCIKLETYLNIIKIPYETVILSDPRKSPKGKLPFIEDKGKKIGDSSLIIEYIEQTYDLKTDAHLNTEQKSTALAIQRLIEEHLYWVLVYNRWFDSNNWLLTKEEYFKSMPKLLRKFIPIIIRKDIIKSIYAQGIGRHTPEQIYRMGSNDISTIAEVLGNKTYMFNNKISIIDATVYAFISSLLYVPINSPLKCIIKEFPNLQEYCERIRTQYASGKA